MDAAAKNTAKAPQGIRLSRALQSGVKRRARARDKDGTEVDKAKLAAENCNVLVNDLLDATTKASEELSKTNELLGVYKNPKESLENQINQITAIIKQVDKVRARGANKVSKPSPLSKGK